MRHRQPVFAAIVLGLSLGSAAVADIRLPHVIGDHMVLQRDRPLAIWGLADGGERVVVEFAGERQTARANARGEWSVTLPPVEAGGPHTMTIQGKNTITLTDILVGEVWIGSGQSNMQWSVSASANAGAEIPAAAFPKIRLFLVPNVLSGIPNRDVNANWKECTPASIPPFSAVLYYFGRHLHRELDIPIGLIASAWGGSRIEPWIPPAGFAGVDRLSDIAGEIRTTQVAYLEGIAEKVRGEAGSRPDLVAWLRSAVGAARKDALVPPAPESSFPAHPLAGWASPTSMFNAMIHPLVPFTVRGAIWYQGESNLAEGMLYACKMRALVEGWRKVWGNDELSFYWAQLAPFDYGGDPERLPRIWEAQREAMSIPRTGMAVITDIGNLSDIHPRNKQEVGRRLALWALAKDYGRTLVHSGPIYRSMAIDGGRIRVTFDHVESGLQSRDGQALTGFEVAGEDGAFAPARAGLDGACVVVESESVKEPTMVRFAWHQRAEPNLQNKEGLPACPFRTYSTAPAISGKKLFVKTSSAELTCLESDGVIRYTLDGSAPTPVSPAYAKPIVLRDTTTVRARFFRSRGAESTIAEATFRKVTARRHAGETLVPGVRYEYYEGSWQSLPDFASLKPVKSGLLDEISLAARQRDDQFAFRFTGYVEITAAGTYTFQTDSDDGSEIYVDDRKVASNDGIHPVASKRGTINLEPGFHKIVVTFFEAAGGEELSVRYEGPGIALQTIPLWGAE